MLLGDIANLMTGRYMVGIEDKRGDPMRYLPLFKNVRRQPCLVVGGGAVAQRKIQMLLRAGAKVTVVSPKATADIRAWHNTGKLIWTERTFQPADVEDRTLVFSATGQTRVDKAVSRAARAARVPIGVVDAPAISDFITPAIVDRSPLVIAISSAGTAPVLARQIRATIETLLPANLGRLASAAGQLRKQVRARIPADARRQFWDGFFRNWRSGALLTGRGTPVAIDASTIDRFISAPARNGRVAIVGAGPGDPDLLTLKALNHLQDADVIIHDRLVGPGVLEYARRDAERIYVGKAPGQHAFSQDRINELLAHHAELGRTVVRLKGGDPFIFGRGGEERDFLTARGIEVEVVPGITAAAGCAAAAGIPLTHRGVAQSVTFLTGTSAGALPDYDWSALVRNGGTLAIYMGVGTADHMATNMMDHGQSPATPVAVIENGTLADQRHFTGTIGTLGALMRNNEVRSPALLLIGEVTAQTETAALTRETAVAS